jgi:NADPH:quinone reductase-like Zn-dependent oxidoreductase
VGRLRALSRVPSNATRSWADDSNGTTVKTFVRDRYGPPDVLELKEFPRPTVDAGEVLVRLRAASLNQADLDYLYGRPTLTRMGTGFRRPRHRGLGLDAAGEVAEVGQAVTAFRPGDEVFGDLTEFGYGAFGEYACAAEQAWALKPPSMSFEEASTVPQSGILALQNLRGRRRIEPGDRVLINGASGNVGPFAVQIAKAFGAHVTGVCRTSKMGLVRALGADEVIDYTVDDYTTDGQRYDWILDIAGNHSLRECRRALKPRGVYVIVGGPTSRIFAALLLGPFISLVGNRKMGIQMGWKPFKQEDVAMLGQLIEDGNIKPVIDRRYGLTEVPEALRYLESGKARGKIVINI